LKITVVTPSYNQAPFLERTLESVHSQRGAFTLEHLVVDGGSSDGSLAILERWKDKLWYVSERDRGQSHALNKGIARATGEIIAWLNSDDTLLPGALDAVSSFFRAHPQAQWVYGRCRIVDEDDVETRRWLTFYKALAGRRFSYSRLLVENYVPQTATFFRKSFYEQVGGVDESLHLTMDYDLWLKMGQLSPPGIIDGDLALFRYHHSSKSGAQIESMLREANELSRKYARAVGKSWLGEVNYWFYYKRNSFIYRLIDRMALGSHP
jgi:glycosyltransferase involved in cell wall biosynthesis